MQNSLFFLQLLQFLIDLKRTMTRQDITIISGTRHERIKKNNLKSNLWKRNKFIHACYAFFIILCFVEGNPVQQRSMEHTSTCIIRGFLNIIIIKSVIIIKID